MPLPTDLDNLFVEISNFIKYTKELDFIKDEYFNSTTFNKGRESHSKMLGVICMAASKLGYFLEIERGLNNGKQFRPDIIIRKDSDCFAVIEYESTNSSDMRIIQKTKTIKNSFLDNFQKYISNPEKVYKPKYWICIVTLPDHKVDGWRSWDATRKYNKNKTYTEKYRKIVSNPFRFYISKYIEELNKTDETLFNGTELILCNLQNSKLHIVFPNNYIKDYSIS